MTNLDKRLEKLSKMKMDSTGELCALARETLEVLKEKGGEEARAKELEWQLRGGFGSMETVKRICMGVINEYYEKIDLESRKAHYTQLRAEQDRWLQLKERKRYRMTREEPRGSGTGAAYVLLC